MGLQLRRTSSQRAYVTVALVTMFMFVAPPLYGSLSSQVASALEPTSDTQQVAAPFLLSPANNTYANGATLTNKWLSVNGATKYIYQSYNDADATAVRTTITTTDTQKTASNVADGTVFWWRVKAVDVQGNESAWSELWKVTIDNKAPSVPTSGTPHDAYEQTNEFDFDWNDSTDSSSGQVRYEFRSSKNQSQVGDAPDNSGAWTSAVLPSSMIHSSGASDGIWHWQVRAIDAAGNKSAWSQVWNMTIDQVNPTLDVQQPGNGEVFGGTEKRYVTVKSVISDATSGLASFRIHMDGIEQPTTLAASLNINVTYDTHELTNGVHTVKVSVFDKAGRSTETTRTFFVDKEAPAAVLEFPNIGPGATSFKVKFNEDVKESEAENPANYFLHNWPGGGVFEDLTPYAIVNYDQTTTTATVSFTDSAWYVSGEQKWGVRNIHDLVGNEITSTSAYSTKMTNPLIENLQSGSSQKDITWTWTGRDPADDNDGVGSGVKSYTYQITNGSTVIRDWTTVSAPGAAVSVTVSVPTDGTYVLRVKATDNAGNVGNEERSSALVDTTGPALTINEPVLNSDGTYRVSGTTDIDSPVVVTRNGVSLGEATLMLDASGTSWTWVKSLGALIAGESYTIIVEQNDGNVANSVSAAKVFPVPPVVTSLLSTVSAGSSTTDFAAILQQPLAEQSQTPTDDTAVLGTQTLRNSVGSDVAAIAATPQGWKIFGIAWYWILVVFAVLVGTIWWTAAAARRRTTAEDI